ncbi:MAG: beta-propeller domain-containing protein, partial [Gammaproteobacteria bacterium]|nr:beta-propeller domain-containing protein [Gammaproteobacteria bacterium]
MKYRVMILSCLLFGCTESTSTNDGALNDPFDLVSGPDLIQLSLADIPAKLMPLYTQSYASRTYNAPLFEMDDAILADTATTGTETSGTNTQETGVDEADRIKVHQDHLYLARQSEGSIDIYQLQGARHAKRGQLVIGEQPLEGLYINNGHLTALSGATAFGMYHWGMPEIIFDDVAVGGYVVQPTDIQINHYDLGKPDQPTEQSQLSFDGQLLSSRMIKGELIMAMSYNPVLPDLRYYPTSEADLAYNKTIIANTPLGAWLPTYSINGVVQGNYLNPEGCYATGYNGAYPTIISLVKVSFDNTPTISSNCFIGEAETLYASTESAYLATTQFNYSAADNWAADITTDVHKFNLGDLSYRGSAAVPGQLPDYSSMRPFALSEHNDVLRMVTYTGVSADSPASIHALTEVMGSLQRISSLPNSTYPDPIGKEGERIYAIRMLGDRGYVVTFRATDPLYVLDLTDPLAMRVSGELEITGFSDYLHIINDRYLLGVGYDAIVDSEGDFRGALTQGVKLSVFDVADPTNPIEVDSKLIGKRGTSTEVSSDHHAFAALP